ncbi:MAG: cache domain-containing protein [Roseibium sp.]
MLKSKFAMLMVAGAVMTASSAAQSEDYGTADEATALLEKAVGHVGSAGNEQAYTDFSTTGNDWQDRDLYVFCFDKDGKVVAHGANAKLIGKNLMKIKDADGKMFIGELISTGLGGGGWVDYRWPNPVSKKVEQKSSVVKQAGADICGVGIYK